MLSSGATLVVGQNAYTKVYSGVDVLTIMATEKDIRSHAYEIIKEKNEYK